MHEAISITGEFNATYLQFKATHQEVSEKSNREERISVEFCGRKIFQYQAWNKFNQWRVWRNLPSIQSYTPGSLQIEISWRKNLRSILLKKDFPVPSKKQI